MIFNKTSSATRIEKLILLILLLTPIFSFQESLALLIEERRGLVNTSNILTSVYIKGLKDLFFILIISSSLLMIIKTLSIKRATAVFLGFILVFILLPAYYYHSDFLIYLSGIRWMMPFILAAFLLSHIDRELIIKLGTIMFYLFIFHFIVQITQLFFSYGHFGLNTFGLSSRNPGIFYIPSTAAVFSILVLFFSKYYMREELERKIYYLIPISILLTASGTGIGIYIIFITIYYLKKNLLPFLPIFLIFLGIILLLSLDNLSGRSGLVEDSLGVRVKIFIDVLLNATYLPQHFGYGTATGLLIVNKFDLNIPMISTDSWYASSIVNLGLINSFLILLTLLILFVVLTMSKDKEKLLFLIIFSLIAITTSITESYPANLILSVFLAYYIKPKNIDYESFTNTQLESTTNLKG